MSKLIQPNRRTVLKGAAAGGLLAATPLAGRFAQAQSSAPIRIGFQQHITGVGAAYGRWYGRTTEAAVKAINDAGGINGRPLEIIAEDDGTDARRGAEVVEKFVNQHDCDVAFGTLFSHVVIGSAPAAGELKMPYFVVSEGHHVASGMLNRYTLQPGITDVKSQVQAMAPFISENLGKKVTMIFPDFAFGHDHRDYFTSAIETAGGEVLEHIAIPPTETSFTRYFPAIPRDTEVIYHVMVGPAVLTFVKELGEFFGPSAPPMFGFIDSLEAVDLNSPGLEFLEGSYFWEGNPRYAQADQSPYDANFRAAVGVDENGASVSDPSDVSTYAHMFGCWETLYIIKDAMEASGYQGPGDRAALVEAVEAMTDMPHSNEHPQGPKIFNGRTHQAFGVQYITQVQDGRLNLVHETSIEDTFYPDEVDYTTQSL
ncbi:ABC transporter substrate-binding protein [Ponticoccus sp. SC2-23]|uniref:ABC transporter substrate-binding protein n=1 Tax=Alexandriicola marinus TaxID=2081710 RepID=UPI000FD82154|nr:ABC transporter substrate-binding protein [Alexandriicola marinus]MBM1222327.1 ABC transporter substrate-binding protein [Ponticoccus sp. SC6-9]MBM1224440.1 ABC transporter substrate-binding protein [Ponticoccus sp. SC6-15]MBM1229780.1 ABC transporter substrate-binding protein [Ponticoccus sp. SC6-38]MBM1233406.1 ABC transporter substrate-binding protein [Ponticoccus sp. SC6-45]MBM1236644.1 ABC transporter substrate-binding protein [Ponticoccus sp. SC6-49]MBM1244688.1 ABC transporter subst